MTLLTVLKRSGTPPTASTTGSSSSIATTESVVSLVGTSSTAPGGATIVSYLWEYVSGPLTGTIASPTSATTTFTPTPAVTSITDTFTRADSNTSMGTTETGNKTWTALRGVWGITSGAAYTVSGVGGEDAWAVIDAGFSDGTVQFKLTATGDQGGIAFRVTDMSNGWLTNLNAGLYKLVGNAYTQIGAGFTPPAAGDTMAAVLSGASIDIRVNGVSRLAVSESTHQTATKHGLRNFGLGATRWDDFEAV